VFDFDSKSEERGQVSIVLAFKSRIRLNEMLYKLNGITLVCSNAQVLAAMEQGVSRGVIKDKSNIKHCRY
jgi:hypothetical protein